MILFNTHGVIQSLKSSLPPVLAKLLVGGNFYFYNSNDTKNYNAMLINSNGTLNTSVAIRQGFDNNVTCSAIAPDGKFYIGGSFTTYQGVTTNRIVRLNTDGTIDTSFNIGTGFNNAVRAITLDSAGKLYVGGQFITYQGVAANRIIKLNTDGSKDTSFNMGTGFGGTVIGITLDSAGKLYVGGGFTTYQGGSNSRIIKLNTDGSKDTSFNMGTGFNSDLNTIVLDSAGKLYVGGIFATYQGVAANRIIKLNTDGSKDTSFDNTTGFNNDVNTIALDSAGKLYVGGNFTGYKSASLNRIIKLNTDGTVDGSFDSVQGFDQRVTKILINSAGKIYAAGAFNLYRNQFNKSIIRLNPDGTKDSGFTNDPGFNRGQLNNIEFNSSGNILAVGQSIPGYATPDNGIVSLLENGTKNNDFSSLGGYFFPLGVGITDAVKTSDNKYYVVGNFTYYQGVSANSIVKLNSDGSIDTSFDYGTGFGSGPSSMRLALDSAGKLYVTGNFTTYKGETNNGIIRLNPDGTKDLGFDNTTGFSAAGFQRIKLDSAGKIYVAGQFTTYKGVAANRIIKLNTDGSRDTSFDMGTGFNNNVNGLTLGPDNKIYAVGGFTTYNGITANRIIKLNTDGTIDTSLNGGSGPTTTANTIALDSVGNIYVGGNINSYNINAVSGIVKINPNGSINTEFNTNAGTGFTNVAGVRIVYTIYIDANDKVYVGGQFTTYNTSTSANCIIRLLSNGNVDTSFDYGLGFNSAPSAIANFTVDTIVPI
jgi:uncharacterized delta-60 repeat protein